MTADRELKVTAAVTDVQYSPDGEYLVVSDEAKKICLFKIPEYEVVFFQYMLNDISLISLNINVLISPSVNMTAIDKD